MSESNISKPKKAPPKKNGDAIAAQAVSTEELAISSLNTLKKKGKTPKSGVLNKVYRTLFDSLLPDGWFSASPDDTSVNRAIRTNNPGALNISRWQRDRPGFVGVTPPDGSPNANRTTIYRTPEHGVAAWYHLLSVVYGFSRTGNFSIEDLAYKYSGGVSKATEIYIANWHFWSGGKLEATTVIDIDDDEALLVLARAMFASEAGQVSPLHDDQILFAIGAERDGSLPTDWTVSDFIAAEILPDDEAILRALAKAEKVSLAAVDAVIAFRNDHRPFSRPRYWAVLDFSLHSKNRRLYLLDVEERAVDRYLCAHGRGSEGDDDDGLATYFSNRNGSNASSLGVYLCAQPYYGDHGLSLRLDGMQDTNSHARERAIVLHGAKYVSDKMIERTGRIGRSKGCPAVENQYAERLVHALKGGSLLIAWKN